MVVVVVVLALSLLVASLVRWSFSCVSLTRHCEKQCIRMVNQKHVLQRWNVLSQVSEKIFYFSLGLKVRIVISDPLLFKELLVDNSDCYCKPSFVQVLDILGNGLFSSCGDDWLRQRQLLSPHFLNKEIKGKIQAMVDTATSAAKSLGTGATKEVDIHNFLLRLTLEILNRTAFKAAEISKNSSDIVKNLSTYHHRKRALVAGLPANLPGLSFLLGKFPSRESRRLTTLLKNVIEQRQCSVEQKQEPLLLDVLLEAAKSQLISRDEAVDNCMTFLLAGHETTASLLTWTFYLLGTHPTWQERARAEVSEFINTTDNISLATLSHLKTLAAILFEALRLFPPQPLIGRSCIKENKVGTLSIPAGVEVILPTASLHRNQEFWGVDADEFRPARFSNGIKNACKHPLAYLPFGTGPRTCIGQSLALAEAKVVLAVFLLHFTWEVSPGYRHCPDATLTLQPKFGMPLLLTPLYEP